MCTPKEPHYFATDLPRYRHVDNWHAYLELFAAAGSQHTAIGEASVFYLYSANALQIIRERVPQARIVVLLRNPLRLAESMHAQALLTRDEVEPDFEKAWNLCEERSHGRSVPRHCRDAKILLYDRLPLLGQQLQRALRVFPRNQVRWWFYDDLCNEPWRVYREVVEFLGLPKDGRTAFPRVNARRRARSQWLAQFTEKPPNVLVDAAMQVKANFSIRRWGILDALRRFNFVPQSSQPSSPALQAQMQSHFARDVAILEALTGRDLGEWLASPA